MFTTRNVAADEELTISYKGEKTAEEPDFTMIVSVLELSACWISPCARIYTEVHG